MAEETSSSPQTPATPPPSTGSGGSAPRSDYSVAMIAHLLGIIGPIGPLIVWLIKKDQSAFVNDQGKEALNFEITMLFGFIAIMVLGFIPIIGLVTCILGPALFVTNLVFCIIGGMAAGKGTSYRYPFALRLIK